MTTILDVLVKHGFRGTFRLLCSPGTAIEEPRTRPRPHFAYARQRDKDGKKGELRIYQVVRDTQDARGRRTTYVNVMNRSRQRVDDICAGFVGIRRPLDHQQGQSARLKSPEKSQGKGRVNRTKFQKSIGPVQTSQLRKKESQDTPPRTRQGSCQNRRPRDVTRQQATRLGDEQVDKGRPMQARAAASTKAGTSTVPSTLAVRSSQSLIVPKKSRRPIKAQRKSSVRNVDGEFEAEDDSIPLLGSPGSPFLQPTMTSQQSATMIFGETTQAKRHTIKDPDQIGQSPMRSERDQRSKRDSAAFAAKARLGAVAESEELCLHGSEGLSRDDINVDLLASPTFKSSPQAPLEDFSVSSWATRPGERSILADITPSPIGMTPARTRSLPTDCSADETSHDGPSNRSIRPKGNIGLETPPFTPAK